MITINQLFHMLFLYLYSLCIDVIPKKTIINTIKLNAKKTRAKLENKISKNSCVCFYGSSMFSRWEELPKLQVNTINSSVAWMNSFDAIEYVDEFVLKYNPILIVYCFGTNDHIQFNKIDDIVNNFKLFVNRVSNETLVLYITPIITPMQKIRKNELRMVKTQEMIKMFCDVNNIEFLDINGSDIQSLKNYEFDGIHLNRTGYKYLSKLIENKISTLLN